jgi:transposase
VIISLKPSLIEAVPLETVCVARQPAFAPWRLALITLMQFLENLSDRQAAKSVRSRIDWKYALGLELTDSGFDYLVLRGFRERFTTGERQTILLDRMLKLF